MLDNSFFYYLSNFIGYMCVLQEIDADIQRLIFQGRVLDDDKKIDDYSM